jgi:hypothetical protein
MKYLTDRVHGRPAQTIQGGNQPVKIELQCSGSPEWLTPQVTVNQQVNHIATDQLLQALAPPPDEEPMS